MFRRPMRSRSSSSSLVLRWAVAGLFVACGRTVLDDPVDVTGTAGANVGSAGTIGTGSGGGTAGFRGTAGFVGGTAGFTGTGGNVVPCVEGATTCVSSQTQQTCVNGAWTSANDCEYVCVGNACSENPKLVFVTSKVFEGGALGGLRGADMMCQSLARAAGLRGTYLAWLSDVTGSPATRFSRNGGPYGLLDGTELSHNWTELAGVGIIVNGISRTELKTLPGAGTSACGPTAVWTNTKNDGTLNDVGFSCDDWSNPFGMGAALGVATFGTLGWTDECMETSATTTTPCAQTAALYCFEQ
jgi:hypothetical protein